MVSGLTAVITLVNPALLWGGAACAAPIIIHLMLRTRARRQAFPAIQFLLASKRSSTRHHRLRHLLLLLLRILVILLLVAALARPISRGSWLSAQGRIKTAAVFLIDDSTSMSYRFEGLSHADRAKEWARQLIQDEVRFPEGSTFMLMTCSTAARDFRWIRDRSDAGKLLNPIGGARHDRGLTDAVTQALEHLAKSKLPGRELYVLTDLTQHAWSTAEPDRWRDAEGVAVFVLDVGVDENVNTRIGPLLDFSAAASSRTALRLVVSVSAGDEPVETAVEAHVDDLVVARSDALNIPEHSTLPATILLPPLDPGLHCGELRLTGSDRLVADDSIFFALEVRAPRRVAVIHRDGLEDDDASEARRIAALISPPTLPDDRRPFQVSLCDVQGFVAGEALAGSDCVVLVDLARIPEPLVKRLTPIVESGGLLLVVPGDQAVVGGADAESLLPAEYSEVLNPVNAAWIEFGAVAGPGDRGADGGGSKAGQAAFAGILPREISGDSISARKIYRYCKTRPREGAVPLARFDTGDIAIWGRVVGSGRVVQWAFSLNQAWGDLGIRAGPALVLIHSLMSGSGQGSERVANTLCREQRTLSVDAAAALDPLAIKVRRGKFAEPRTIQGRAEVDARFIAGAAEAGGYVVIDNSGRTQATYAVNIRTQETEGGRVAADRIRAFFAPESALVIRDRAALLQRSLSEAGDRELDGYALVALLALLFGESLLANRFYRGQ